MSKVYKLSKEEISRIDENIRPFVLELRQAGFATFASCEGGKGHSHERAWIRIAPKTGHYIANKKWPKDRPKVYTEFNSLLEYVRRWPVEATLSIWQEACTANAQAGPLTRHYEPFVAVFLDLNFFCPIYSQGQGTLIP